MKKKTHKLCEICNKETKRATTRFCSIKCRGIWAQGQRFGGSPSLYKEASYTCAHCHKEKDPRTKKYCSKACEGLARTKIKDISCCICTKIFKPRNKDSKYCNLECLRLSMVGKPKSEEHRKKLSEAALKRDMSGKNNPHYGKPAAHGNGCWHTNWENQTGYLRSSWELAYAKYLDELKIPYLMEHKAFPITYNYNNEIKEGTYRPDFYLTNEDKFIEIKGWWRDDAKEKFEAFKQTYPEILIDLIEKDKLLELKLVDKHGRSTEVISE